MVFEHPGEYASEVLLKIDRRARVHRCGHPMLSVYWAARFPKSEGEFPEPEGTTAEELFGFIVGFAHTSSKVTLK
jgi:hypothetical protein